MPKTRTKAEPTKVKWNVKLAHPSWALTADQCPNCEFPEAEGGYCPSCGWVHCSAIAHMVVA